MMVNEKKDCCGCEACINICNMNCIQFTTDEYGFRYPHIDVSKCVSCRLCEKVCPMKKDASIKQEPQFYAAYNSQDERILLDSSSGGIFWLLTMMTLSKEGVVYGAYKNGLSVLHGRGINQDECAKFRKSKYLQSRVGYSYRQAKDDLEQGKQVLFSGTPCQIAALNSYLGKDYSNLLTVDVICHGVPSQTMFDLYIKQTEKNEDSKIIGIDWRDKSKGWGPNRISIRFENGKEIDMTSRENIMQKGYLKNLYLRPSCYECKFARLPRTADISLGDFWGYDGELKSENNNRGISLVIVSTTKGSQAFETIKEKITYHQVEKEYATQKSRHIYMPPKFNPDSVAFMESLIKKKDITYLDKHFIHPRFLPRIKKRICKLYKRNGKKHT